MNKKYKSSEEKKSKVAEAALALSYLTASEPTSVHSILNVDSKAVAEPLSRIDTFRKGLNRKSFDRLKEITGLDNNTLAEALGVSSKTIQRKEIFGVIQSEKMYDLAELYALGISYFGKEGFRRWMDRPLFSIGNRKPIELIDVAEGLMLLKAEIMRLQHGIAI
ncbi:MAG: antitoxin Xre-like helix-turn-helix domain-containing protein [Mariniphaga sp.]